MLFYIVPVKNFTILLFDIQRKCLIVNEFMLWDLSNKNHSQFNLIKINTILYKYVCILNVKNKDRYVLQ
jgi:hypothetical protein